MDASKRVSVAARAGAIGAPRSWFGSGRIAVFCCSLLVLLLPSLVVGLSVGNPAGPDEQGRVQRILEQRSATARIDSHGSGLFHTAAISDATWPFDEAARRALLVRARRMQVLGITAIALLTYLSVLLASGRLQALLACGLLAVMPPVLHAGHVLRPETPATMFALLSLVLLQSAARPAPGHRHRRPRRSLMVGGGLMLCAALAAAMTCEVMPSLGTILLLPGIVLLVGSLQLLPRGLRSLRRRGLVGTPIRAINRRLVPWTALALVAPATTWWLLHCTLTVSVEAIAVSTRQSALLPDAGIGYGATALLLGIGLLAFVTRVCMRLGRGGRIGPDLILLVYCALFLLLSLFAADNKDPLPRLPALAIVLSEGLRAILVLVLGLVARRRS